MLTRITATGTVYPGNEDAIVKMAQKNIRIFLQTGIDSDDELDNIIDKLELRDFDELVSRLKENQPTVILFRQIAANNTNYIVMIIHFIGHCVILCRLILSISKNGRVTINGKNEFINIVWRCCCC